MSDDTSTYFAVDYAEARQKFKAAASAADAHQEDFRCPFDGPEGLELSTDVAVFGDENPDSVLLVVSATHGAEGFAGSAIQVGVLTNGISRDLRPGQRVILVHALNPFGFAHLRRTNEDNIDLNRNFIDHTAPRPENDDYGRLAELMAPEDIGLMARFWTASRLDLFRLRFGEGRYQAAITAGQYTHPDGLFYGGTEPAWSQIILAKIVEQYAGTAARVALVDVHTGLGPFGHGEFIMSAPEYSETYTRACRWWGDRVRSTISGESVSSDLTGTIEAGLARMLPDAELTAGGLEFGTLPMNDVMGVLRDENWLWHHGSKDHPRAAGIYAAVRRAYAPDSEAWRNRVWTQGQDVVNRALTGLADAI